MELPDSLKQKISQKVRELGVDLYDVRFFRAGPRSMLRVYIDRETGVQIDDCENVSRELSVLLNVEDFTKSPYTLEVTSPGIDRPLTAYKDFKRNIGRRISLTLRPEKGKKKKLRGTLQTCTEENLTLQTDSKETQIPLSEILSGRVEVTFK